VNQHQQDKTQFESQIITLQAELEKLRGDYSDSQTSLNLKIEYIEQINSTFQTSLKLQGHNSLTTQIINSIH
jgi:hypothetical protein